MLLDCVVNLHFPILLQFPSSTKASISSPPNSWLGFRSSRSNQFRYNPDHQKPSFLFPIVIRDRNFPARWFAACNWVLFRVRSFLLAAIDWVHRSNFPIGRGPGRGRWFRKHSVTMVERTVTIHRHGFGAGETTLEFTPGILRRSRRWASLSFLGFPIAILKQMLMSGFWLLPEWIREDTFTFFTTDGLVKIGGSIRPDFLVRTPSHGHQILPIWSYCVMAALSMLERSNLVYIDWRWSGVCRGSSRSWEDSWEEGKKITWIRSRGFAWAPFSTLQPPMWMLPHNSILQCLHCIALVFELYLCSKSSLLWGDSDTMIDAGVGQGPEVLCVRILPFHWDVEWRCWRHCSRSRRRGTLLSTTL